MKNLIEKRSGKKLPGNATRNGNVLGNDTFEESSMKLYDRKKKEGESLTPIPSEGTGLLALSSL